MAVHAAWAENAGVYAIAQVVATLAVLVPVTELVYRHLELRSIQIGATVVASWRQGIYSRTCSATDTPGG